MIGIRVWTWDSGLDLGLGYLNLGTEDWDWKSGFGIRNCHWGFVSKYQIGGKGLIIMMVGIRVWDFHLETGLFDWD